MGPPRMAGSLKPWINCCISISHKYIHQNIKLFGDFSEEIFEAIQGSASTVSARMADPWSDARPRLEPLGGAG